jgi:hypothetical protein
MILAARIYRSRTDRLYPRSLVWSLLHQWREMLGYGQTGAFSISKLIVLVGTKSHDVVAVFSIIYTFRLRLTNSIQGHKDMCVR